MIEGRARAHSLEWGLKESFRRYFERLPDHVYGLTDGAVRNAAGEFGFPHRLGFGPEGAGGTVLAFSGRVALTAHFGALSVVIADPEVLFGQDGSVTLSAAVDEVDGRAVRMDIADLALEVGRLGAPEVRFSASLARDGQYLFMGNYFAGDALDPVTIRFADSQVP
ncbi:HtaA domain-containing protein [Georgenia sp. AZ-5]|uniref:HtaA domain-containing protein n=1 Tax=Georgenia sp. AZ-5 TaxID=3367526 RepID=UPI00375485D4